MDVMDGGNGGFQPQNRNEAMGQGINGAGAMPPAIPDSMLQRQRSMNPGPARVKMSGSGNGMSAAQNTATMSGQLPVQNGIATGSYDTMKWSMR